MFTVLSVLLGLAVGLALAEMSLRLWQAHLRASEHMDPGLISYDERLGWRLTPNWTGRHAHYDFETAYTVNRYRFRGDFVLEAKTIRHAVLGDSFTFGLGVKRGQSFVQLLNTKSGQIELLNFAVPGYSTDQQLLLLREQVALYEPSAVWLVVYLGNDLLDIRRHFPLQANRGKPRFRLEDGRLVLENVPVPIAPKTLRQQRRDQRALLGPRVGGWLRRRVSSLALSRLLGLAGPRWRRSDARERHAGDLALFRALVEASRRYADAAGIRLELVVLPGRAFVVAPDSYSARLQDFFRSAILEYANRDREGLTTPLLPHHRTYGSRIRRFGELSQRRYRL